MNDKSGKSGWSIDVGASIGLSALIGILISIIVGMLRVSGKQKDEAAKLRRTVRPASAPLAGELPASAQQLAPKSDSGKNSPAAEAYTSAKTAAPDQATVWKPGTKYFVSAILVLAFIWVLHISRHALSTIIFAILLTVIIHPVTLSLQRRFKMRYGTATVISYLLVLFIIILMPFVIIPSFIEAFSFIAQIDFAEMLAQFSQWLLQTSINVAHLPIIGASLSSNLEEFANVLNGTSTAEIGSIANIDYTQVGGRIAQTIKFLVAVFGPIIALGTSVVFTILISLHINLSIDMIHEGAKKLVPEIYRKEIMELIYRLINIWQSFLRGQLVLMIVVGILVWIGNAILGMPQALFLGFVSGILEVIPSLGPVLATIPAVILALFFGSNTSFLHLNQLDPWVFALVVLGFYILVQVLENQLLVPYILGDAVDLPPMVILSGVLIGGSAFGILGVFLATPMISSAWEIFTYAYDKILESPPPQSHPETKPSLMDTIRGHIQNIRVPRFIQDRRMKNKPANTPQKTTAEDTAADQGSGKSEI